MDGFFTHTHPAAKIFVSIFVIFLCFIAFFIGGLLLAIPIFNISISDITNIASSNSSIEILKYLQIIQAFGLFIIPSLILSFLFKKNNSGYLQLKNKSNIISIILAISIIFVSLPFINFLAEINAKIKLPEILASVENWMKSAEENAMVLTEKFLKVDTVKGLLFNIFMIGILPAVGEELLFRGIFQRLFSEWTKNAHWGIFISAFLFSAFHMQFYGFFPRLLLGMILGYFLYWSKSLWLPIIAHFVNNTMAVITYYFITKGDINEDFEKIGSQPETLYSAIISLVLMGGFLFLLFKNEQKKIK